MANIPFNYRQDFAHIDFRAEPERYQVGRGEQGVLLVEPYKSELLPLWRFRTPELAETSAQALMAQFEEYRRRKEFVGMDMARKFIQMGYTRARRYANHAGGKKYAADGSELPRTLDKQKAASAAIFKKCWDQLRQDEDYLAQKRAHQARYG